MIDLNKLNNIHSELQNKYDIQNLVDNYKETLNIINNISKDYDEINKLKNNIDKTSNILYKISKQLNIKFEKFDIPDISYYFTEFLDIRIKFLSKTYNTLKKVDYKNITPENFIKKYYDRLYLKDSIQIFQTKITMNILEADLDEKLKDRFCEKFQSYTAHHFNNEHDFTYYAMKNKYYTIEQNAIYKQMKTKEFDTIINEIHKKYPTFKKDLDDTLQEYFSLISSLKPRIQIYQNELTNINNILEIYK